MKALPLWQPWATLIALGEKKIETRSWKPYESLVGQRIAIHACKGGLSKRDEVALVQTNPSIARVLAAHALKFDELPRGAIIATARLTRYRQFDAEWVAELERRRPTEIDFGDYTIGRYGWIFDDVRKLDEPVECKGHQGVFPLSMSVIEKINGWQPLGAQA